MNRFNRKIEEEIKKALESGAFQNLPGKGKPLDLQENPHLSPDWRLTHHLLRANDFSLPWIERRREIDKRFEAARTAVARVWVWRQEVADREATGYTEGVWQRALETFWEEIAEINQSIRDYNLEAPSPRFHLLPIQADREIGKIIAGMG